ncbi:PREDICTED: protein Shroom1 isoform X2 [Ficedula albicollis]|uniref:protein Shroom1 isoform X2 n=1 Tax=Ficedula albicollis TaxID=59894 RepID=UPI0007AD942C|nr:PREDICTED: protein Shroom1 isoform X2 [Ficedula albicollis]
MTSAGNELERWAHRQGGRTGKLAEPVASPENDRLLSVKSISSVDHLLHLPGKADSAYSSSSGGSNAPEYLTPSRQGENCVLPEQVPYMDLEYVTGIYHLSAARPDLSSPQPCKAPDPSSHKSSHSSSLTDGCGITPTQRTSALGPAALAAPAVSPAPQLSSHHPSTTDRHWEKPRERQGPAGHTESSVQAAPGVQHQPADRDEPWSQHWDAGTEQGVGPNREKTLENKGLSSHFTNKVSKVQALKTEENGEWSPSQQPTKRSNPHIFSRPRSFIFQEYLKTDPVANVPKILSAYNSGHANKISKETNSTSYHQAHSSPSAVNDTQEVKQCPRGVCEPSAREAALPSPGPGPSQRRESLPCAQSPLCAEWHSDMGQGVLEDSSQLKYMENALLNKNAARKLNSYADKNQCCDSEGKILTSVREPVPNQQSRVQRSALSCSCSAVEVEGWGQGRKQCCDGTSQMALFRPKEDSTSRSLREVQKENQGHNSSPDLSTCLEQEKPLVQKHQAAFQTQLFRQLQEEHAAEQITRQATPMLYYLSAGKTTRVRHHNKDSRSSPKEIPSRSYTASAQCPEIPREGYQLQRSSYHHQHTAADLLQNKDLIFRSPVSPTEDSFQNDYIEKLKVAQKKVLKETSFKRKDLQMSLPVRLRQKSSKRPSVEHLRSFSLSSASKDAKPAPCSPSRLESLESFNRNEETQRPQKGQAGGRKRVTQEQKKLCYSEPEKLHHLMDKEVSWSQARVEITEQDAVASRRRGLENRGRAFSSSSVSRTELKQIQHSALVKYVERKISQRPGSSQHLQKRLSNPKGPSGQISNPNGSSKMQNDEVFCQLLSEQKSPDVFPPLPFAPPLNVTSRCNASEGDGSCASKCPSAESLPQAGASASGRAPERPKPTPSSTQDPCRCARGAAAPCRSCGSCPSFHDAEKDGSKDHERNDITGRVCGQDKKEQTPETCVPVPRSGSKEGTGAEEECRAQSLPGDAALRCPEQQQPAPPPEQGVHLHTAPAQPQRGDAKPAKGLPARETPVRDDAPLGRETHPPTRRLQSSQDQQYRELATEIIAKDSSLVHVLMPDPLRKTALDLMEGLFPLNISLLDKSRRKRGKVQTVQENDRKSRGDGAEECPKSEQETKQRSKDPAYIANQVLKRNRDSTNKLDDITSKKLELMASLQRRLQALREEQELVLSEVRDCARWGEELERRVRELCTPSEFQRYTTFIGDLEKVLSLLLCLSCRLARVQNAISRMDGSTEPEEKSLRERHKLLSRQREDAKDLKENLDRRERVVSGILAKYLTEQQLQDYQHFVQVKTSLLIEQKDLEEQIKFFKEQLENLDQSIPI